MKYKNPVHAIIFKTFVIQSQYKLSNRFLSAVFLLSADKDLWLKAKRGIPSSFCRDAWDYGEAKRLEQDGQELTGMRERF